MVDQLVHKMCALKLAYKIFWEKKYYRPKYIWEMLGTILYPFFNGSYNLTRQKFYILK